MVLTGDGGNDMIEFSLWNRTIEYVWGFGYIAMMNLRCMEGPSRSGCQQ